MLGGIDLDPCTTEQANAARAQAPHIFTAETNGLVSPWPTVHGVFMNPPGGKIGGDGKLLPPKSKLPGTSAPLLFWAKLMQHRAASGFGNAIVMAFTLEQLARTQGHGIPSMCDFPMCIPGKRIRYTAENGRPGMSPTHASAIVYVPGRVDSTDDFAHVFGQFGAIVLPRVSV